MKNSQIFEKKYFEIITKEEIVVLEKFKDGVKNEFQFNYVSNGILETYTNEINSILDDQLVKDSYRFIESTLDEYQGDQISKIIRILDNDFNSFVSEHEKEIDLTELIENIAKLHALQRVQINHDINLTPYSFMYKLNDFKDFTYKNIEKDKPELTEKLRLRIYPSAVTDNKKRKKDYSRETENTKKLLEYLSQSDKKVLFKAYLNFVKKDVPTTELMKLTLMISNLNDLDIFFKNPNDTSLYTMIKRDFSSNEIKTLENLKNILRQLELNNFIQYIAHLNIEFLAKKNKH
ncbi:hypothetical protein LB450_00990 [Psychroflexus sp. CAK1W]|uniref:hypothetical protein n=1 Tax=Psychroflexus curvus TaxID=2873595 RepID=UPI001CCA1A93|nr:hypothetical protein [Psychroflexus curvus]MBZ9626665.1 hypothetical protein [Psychroflexus curvus]